MSKKIAVIFPGMGYHCDKPLLYYSKKIAAKNEYEVIELNYDFEYEVHKSDKEKVFEDAYSKAVEILSEVDFSAYSRIVFIGKSIGTVVAAKYNIDYDVVAELIIFTPVPETFAFIQNADCIIFHGSNDPMCDTDIVVDYCEENCLTYGVIPKANHSLETGNVIEDIETVKNVMSTVEKIL